MNRFLEEQIFNHSVAMDSASMERKEALLSLPQSKVRTESVAARSTQSGTRQTNKQSDGIIYKTGTNTR